MEFVHFAEAYGWTPRQVLEEVPAWLIPWFQPIRNMLRGDGGERSG